MPYKNKEDQKAWGKRYREGHKEELKKYKANYFRENRERELEKTKQWRKNNPEKDKEHHRNYAKKHKEKIKEYGRRWHLKDKFNLSHEEWLRIWINQNEKCAICEMAFSTPCDACVDHNHETGKIRGLLCVKCNAGIGYLNDDPKITSMATKYLLKI